jgi:predicted aspartyl protease
MKHAFHTGAVALCLLAAPAAAASDLTQILSANRAASGGDAWNGKTTLKADYAYSGQGLTGTITSTTDLQNARWVDSFTIGPASGGNGFDGKNAWNKDVDGTVKLQSGGDERQLAVNEAYRRANLWWRSDRGGAAITAVGDKSDAGNVFDMITVTPKEGKAFDAWFNTRTHLLARVVEVQSQLTVTTALSDYRAVDGAEIAGRIVVDTGQGAKYVQTLTLKSASFFAPQPDEIYAPPKVNIADFSIAGGAKQGTIPFQLLNNHIYASVHVNGRGPLLFIFDTGGRNLLTPPEAKALGANVVGQMPAGGAGEGVAEAGFAKIQSLQIGDATFKDQLFAVIPFIPREVEGFDEQGMVGFEVFRRFVTQIDYGNGTLTLIDPKSFDPAKAGTPIPFVFDGDTPEVEGTFENIPAKFNVDTGSRVELTLTKPFAEKHQVRETHPKGVDTVDGWGVGGPTRSWVTRAKDIAIGPIHVPNVVTSLSTQSKGAFSAASYEGNIGTGLLKRFVVTFDYGRSIMYLKPVAKADEDTGTYDRAGLWLNLGDHGFRVAYLTPNAPAEEAGLRVGDEILMVNGKSAQVLSLSDIRKVLRDDSPGTKVLFGIRRGGKSRRVVVTLRDLI